MPFASQSVAVQEILFGIIVASIVSIFTQKFFVKDEPLALLKPSALLNLIAYIPVFFVALVKSNIDVAKRALSPKVDVNPGIVKIKTDLKSDYGLAMLANSITLTPGTITMDIKENDGEYEMFIHWIDVKTQDVEEASEEIKGNFEPRIRRIFK